MVSRRAIFGWTWAGWLGCVAVSGAGALLVRADAAVPDWTADAIWYQVLVPRFCNGDPSNDPPQTVAWDEVWDHLLPGEAAPLRTRLFYRRYGGDLAGLRQKLPYLADLGINTLYLNPIFQAPSEHKYDTADHRHVDDTIGVADSRLALPPETPDPATWCWSASDRLFLELLAEAHRRGMRVVVDGVFNHVGREFWAWRDVLARGAESPYGGWFEIREWGPPLAYDAWDGVNGHLPEFQRTREGLHPEVEAYLFAVVRRWMDPNGDGDPSDGVDGWRLDAAEQVPLAFWRKFRRVVKEINPEAVILGEIWTSPTEWLAGDAFDIVTNYPFSNAVVRWVSGSDRNPSTTTLADELVGLNGRYRVDVTRGMFNLLSSHDTERLATMMLDYPPPVEGVRGSRDQLAPTAEAYRRACLAALVQFASPGGPVIYYGEEVGMAGGDDPFCRGPMRWSALADEINGGRLRAYYQRLCTWRRASPALRRGGFRPILADEARQILAFLRGGADGGELIVINAGGKSQRVTLQLGAPGMRIEWRLMVGTAQDLDDPISATDAAGRVTIACPALSGQVGQVSRGKGLGDERPEAGGTIIRTPRTSSGAGEYYRAEFEVRGPDAVLDVD